MIVRAKCLAAFPLTTTDVADPKVTERVLRIRLQLSIQSGGWPQARQLRKLATAAFSAARTALALSPGETELSLLFTDDAAIRKLNAEWRDKDKPTNVLSFPAFLSKKNGPTPALLGDIVLAIETVRREAEDEGKLFESHLSHLLVHGFLHLLGYDHETEAEALEMETLERQILARLAIDDPYA